jgi:hypothetical protein
LVVLLAYTRDRKDFWESPLVERQRCPKRLLQYIFHTEFSPQYIWESLVFFIRHYSRQSGRCPRSCGVVRSSFLNNRSL